MAVQQAIGGQPHSVADAHLARVAEEGLAGHPHLSALTTSVHVNTARDLSDAVHLLCQLYGRHPGLIEIALTNCPTGVVRDWLLAASDSFERERLFLVRLTSAVGPMPSTPGATDTETALLGQRHAIETLARSERSGCALGAATALIEDWRSIRTVLDCAAVRSSIECPLCTLPDRDSIVQVVSGGASTLASERALGFGGQQLVLQNRGLFDLLEARASARADS
jgi:hypothetical protein